ncbi:hypothetical protein NH458_00660 [Lactococcus garvieae]|uniref:hypothetical protein n=1 Tax=Lactococcus TaxID=1357 RepID=UPI002098426B|nr:MULTISPECIES: hypothetical protein [Lactococcus]MCO7128575.1 hypothetical protein [Lactococcus garvieae]WKY24554.1 hypothetical protein P3G65_01725 [Lactococcus sp. bn62]
MKLKDIEPVGVIVQEGNDHGLIESEVIQGISTLPVGTKLYTAEQMKQAYMAGVDYGYEARESHEELLNSGEAQDEEV